MYIYNVTTNIDEEAHDQWLLWMKATHIPDMLATGKFTSAKICKVLVEEEQGGHTYAVQFSVATKALLMRYYEEDAPRMRQDALARFPGQFVSFRTEMEVVEEQHTVQKTN